MPHYYSNVTDAHVWFLNGNWVQIPVDSNQLSVLRITTSQHLESWKYVTL